MPESGSLYRIKDIDSSKFERLESGDDWYDLINDCGVGTAPKLNLEQCWPIWIEALKSEDKPLNKLLFGDLYFEAEGDAPSIGVSCHQTVLTISSILNEKNENYFLEKLNKTGFDGSHAIFIFQGMRKFYNLAAQEGNAIISLL
ncbi:MAG: hypothetical protein RL122_1852 [Pseudomonadota bacterium]|jgi:hypothetical protein